MPRTSFAKLFIATVGATLLGGLSAASAAILSDNLGQTQSATDSINDLSFAAQAFTTTGTDFVIDSVTVAAHKSGSGVTGTLNLFFYDNTGSGGLPGTSVSGSTPIASVDASALATTAGSTHAWTLLNYSLAPSTTYYVVLGGASVSGGQFQWDYTTSTSGTGFPSNYADSSNSGASWGSLSTANPQQMQVTAVPEPSVNVLGAIAAVTAAVTCRRTRSSIASRLLPRRRRRLGE